MAISSLAPPPYDSDIIDPAGITISENGITPGSMRMSPAFAIWLQQLFTVGSSSQSTDILSVLEEGYADNSAQRIADEAISSISSLEDVANLSGKVRQIEKSIAEFSESPNLTSNLRNLSRYIESQGESSQRNWSVITGTHAVRLKTPAGGHNLKRLFFETDRNALYLSIANVWIFSCGIMVAAAASRPSDLGTNDTFFGFIASDTLNLEYWDGSAWHTVEAPPSGAAGGDFTGTYPNPTLIAVGPGAGTYTVGNRITPVTGNLGTITIDTNGRITAIQQAT